ncbi:hypothetical protein [Streptomyces sp. NPDC016845]|uniref:hypothetical protein n=1 Tax=Streptomyces sp. NPDC016845 TaxID=3364972 RepID=UPI0037BE03AE
MTSDSTTREARTTYADVLADRRFRVLLAAGALVALGSLADRVRTRRRPRGHPCPAPATAGSGHPVYGTVTAHAFTAEASPGDSPSPTSARPAKLTRAHRP